ncbi:MAG: hypothetical protein FJ096_00065 [Deltaproteobacteria bacterium]|nr:hypothetical protein [Deltaproteobacteria bacterium]
MLAIAMTTTLFGSAAFAETPSGKPGSREQGAAKPDRSEATAELVVAHGTNGGKGIDPKLARHKELKNPPFSSYNSYALLEETTRGLSKGKPATVQLPDGRELKVLLEEVDEKGGKPTRFTVKATMKKPGSEESTVQFKAKPGVMFFVAGQRYEGGILVLGLKIR